MISQCKASEIREFETFRQVKENQTGSRIAERENRLSSEAGEGDGSQVLDDKPSKGINIFI